MRYYIKYISPVADLYLVEERGQLVEISFHQLEHREEMEEKRTELLEEAERQLQEYFAGRLQHFDLPLHPQGTEFQKKVWKALMSIPYGETRSYGEIAKQIGKEKAVRAVGGANHVNPISIVIPCHRVIGKNGSLTGYGGGLKIKETLLTLERKKS
ncbi:cysteine methyltransferase [Fusobacterium necrophorum subsp. funduliforme]|uniref:Methylated-DNA--protein-cysteine methyltransferase n=6 Tax=Fusobacterium necrophorum TaxID=859 RepID=A0A4Q2L2D5_9FUSO|nr:methylated-DNA--[protein]-cysteine S-methyltransferase [Fusobacterium necrophorum]AVQ21950.1 cysteine methyltransferase [Fusobacterium necrophorum subsp. funduliforme]AYV93439.1 methylated-DNA--[protein]-cysteine S-methyltransferase [Fusobacterium necrophorum subsp. funduliforme]AYV95565.1 methylated-DNA--[protein]-cysteine S-methyltransferase [Fusobacterium necrophorum subsp. funduliforme]AYZ74411.1 methylated-DNA--[protein]-cysteine S-methyltransferase [Fusobacterium necrophorum]AZW09703.